MSGLQLVDARLVLTNEGAGIRHLLRGGRGHRTAAALPVKPAEQEAQQEWDEKPQAEFCQRVRPVEECDCHFC